MTLYQEELLKDHVWPKFLIEEHATGVAIGAMVRIKHPETGVWWLIPVIRTMRYAPSESIDGKKTDAIQAFCHEAYLAHQFYKINGSPDFTNTQGHALEFVDNNQEDERERFTETKTKPKKLS